MINTPYFFECLGTALLILLGNGVVAGTLLKHSKGKKGHWLAIIFGWGFAVTTTLWIITPFHIPHLNPAITLGLALNGLFEWKEAIYYIISQLTGAFIGSILLYLIYFQHFKETKNTQTKLSCFATTPAIHHPFYNLIAEIIATTIFILAALSLPTTESYLKPLLTGFIIMSIGLSFGGLTGYALNPARDLMPRIVYALLSINNKGVAYFQYAWIPVLGPIIGGFLAIYLYSHLI